MSVSTQDQDEGSKTPFSHKLHRTPGDTGALNTQPVEDWKEY